jgi:hypothetical protein
VARGGARAPRLKSAVVIGTEHVAFSAIWTARHAGLRVRAMIGAEDRIMSFAPLGALARAVGIEIITPAHLREIVTGNGAPSAVILDTPQGIRQLPTDVVIFTGNWIPEVAALAGGPITLDPRSGGPEIDQAMRTSAPGIFAAGNVLHGVESSGWCANEGRHAGLMIARYLRGEIGGTQAGHRLDLSGDIAFLVPQRWGGTAEAAPVSLRVAGDVHNRRLALTSGAGRVWVGKQRSFLRRRRIAVPAINAATGVAIID